MAASARSLSASLASLHFATAASIAAASSSSDTAPDGASADEDAATGAFGSIIRCEKVLEGVRRVSRDIGCEKVSQERDRGRCGEGDVGRSRTGGIGVHHRLEFRILRLELQGGDWGELG